MAIDLQKRLDKKIINQPEFVNFEFAIRDLQNIFGTLRASFTATKVLNLLVKRQLEEGPRFKYFSNSLKQDSGKDNALKVVSTLKDHGLVKTEKGKFNENRYTVNFDSHNEAIKFLIEKNSNPGIFGIQKNQHVKVANK